MKQKETKKYRIIGRTNPWMAQRNILFNGRTRIVLDDGMTLREAQNKLLEYYCQDAGEYFPNWGVAVNTKRLMYNCSLEAYPTRTDGTRIYERDGKYFEIEPEEDPGDDE